MSRIQLSRRTLLRGAGVAMALPWLESLPVWGNEPTAGALPDTSNAAPTYPKRFAALFMACGVNANHWWAKGSGEEMELGKSLEPLAHLKIKLNVISGLFNRAAVGVGIHPGQTGNVLSGAQLQKGAELKGGISMDQALANAIGQETVQPSLVLGCEQPTTGYHETNFSMAYSSHISWQNATSPVPMEVYPALAFDSLFDNRGSRRNKSVLDRVADHAASLRRQVSENDQRKLDEYLESVREVEKRIVITRDDQAKAADKAKDGGKPLAAMKRPDNGLPEDIREHMRLMCDIVALAFQTDKTRVATLLLCRDISGLFYPFLDARKAHHSASHDDLSDEYERISRYYVSQLAYLASRLDAMPEADGTVLDHSGLLYLSNMWSGSKHDSTKLPLLLVGGLDGTLETGRVLDYLEKPDDQRKLCSLYLSIMDRMGWKQEGLATPKRDSSGSDSVFRGSIWSDPASTLEWHREAIMRQTTSGGAGDESGVAPAFYQRVLQWLAAKSGDIDSNRPWYIRYGAALAALAIATTIRHLLEPVLGDRAPYGAYLIAVVFVAWTAGFGPALLTVVGGTLLGRYFFHPPRFSFGPVTESSEVAFIMSVTVGVVTVLFCESLRITARENRRLYELARQADARKDAFLATLAHELRNPLAPIRNAVYLLEQENGDQRRTAELHGMISRHIDQLIRLVNELLDVSRITQRKIQLRRERIDIQSIVNAAAEAVRPLLNEKRQRLEVNVPQTGTLLQVDGMRLTQVVTNLLHNAAKYTAAEGRIWLTAEIEGGDLLFRVRDTGVGIPPEACNRIFDLFEQVDQGIENSQGGLGIGLTLVRELVQLHGGTVEAHSAGPGLGSEFIVRLPDVVSAEADRKAYAAVAAAAPHDTQDGDSLRVLVVDDSPGVARSLELVLLDWNHDVRVCYDAFAALETARKFKPDFVLADLGMPKMNGYQLAEELRRLPGLGNTVLVAVSGYGQDADKQRSQEVGFARHLTKPVDLLELKQVLTVRRSRPW